MIYLVAYLLVVLQFYVICKPSETALVILDNLNDASLYSNFLKRFEELNVKVTLKESTSSDLSIDYHGNFLFDTVVVLATKPKSLGGSLTSADLIEYLNGGGNLLIASGLTDMNAELRKTAQTLGVKFSRAGEPLRDAGLATGDSPLPLMPSASPLPAFFSRSPLQFNGLPHYFAAEANLLVTPLYTAPETAYTPQSRQGGHPEASGADLFALSIFQARNNARAVLTSAPALSDANGGSAAARDALTWLLHHSGELRIVEAFHRSVDEELAYDSAMYTVGEQIEYVIRLEEFAGGKWIPHVATDLQLELKMLDPQLRAFVPFDKERKCNRLVLRLPDVYGVFTFSVHYERPALSLVEDYSRKSIRPRRHDQFERFIPQAYPYYVGSFAMLIAFLAVSFFMLTMKDQKRHQPEKPKTE